MDKKTQAAFDGDPSAALGIANIFQPADENRDELHGCAEHKSEGIRNPHLEQGIRQRFGRGGLKKEEENRTHGQQPESRDNGCEKVKGKPGDDEKGEDSKAKPP